MPLGPLYLVAALEEHGYEVDFRDFQLCGGADHFDVELFCRFLDNSAPILGVSCFIDMLPLVILAMERVKRQYPDKVVILGGPGPSSVAEEILRRFPFIDVIVRGEGEETIVDLLGRLREGRLDDIFGISYHRDGEIRHNPPRSRIKALDSLPFPAYNHLDWPRYSHARIVTARGCPYACAFCDIPGLWHRQCFKRDIGAVVAEIELLKERFGQSVVDICDDIFVLDRDRVLAACQELKGGGLSWTCFGRANLMDEELMRHMAEAGCFNVFYGVESGSDKVLSQIGKGTSIAQAESVLALSADYFGVTASYIWGFPFEGIDDFYQTVQSMARVVRIEGDTSVALHLLSPSPLSGFHSRYKRYLRFSKDLPTALLLGRPLGEGLAESHTSVVDLITRYPSIFQAFYFYDLPHMETECRIIELSRMVSRLVGKAKDSGELQDFLVESSEQVRGRLRQAASKEESAALSELLTLVSSLGDGKSSSDSAWSLVAGLLAATGCVV